ncbi:SDR family oxidoreductase [Jongsikchunia kroppenstedtii]|uniref:SDR family oxidoreductase n=1 Tax=Jongsikchunia kroppenstedtii TaxID=1121721 RepID=UPI0003642547|nr:SDR family oxidoreductase [Jongsikchunia kroppenstedtii]
MARIVIIGGHGKIALLAAPRLIGAGHEVTSIIRNPDHAADVEDTGATPLIADVENMTTDQIGTAIAGHDVVVWSAGAGGGNPERTYAVDRDAAIRTIDAAVDKGVDRFIMVSYFGAAVNHGVPQSNSFFHYAEAKAAADEYLRESALRWTILGPSTLTLDPPTGLIETVPPISSGKVTRGDVASVIAAVVDRDDTIGQFIRFNNGDTPIALALG